MFRLRRLARIGAATAVMSKGVVLPARRARFLSHVHFVWQAWGIRGIWRSETWFCVAGTGHRALFHSRGTRGAFCALLKRFGIFCYSTLILCENVAAQGSSRLCETTEETCDIRGIQLGHHRFVPGPARLVLSCPFVSFVLSP